MSKFILSALGFFLLISCGTTKAIAFKKAEPMPIQQLVGNINKQKKDFKQVKTKVKIKPDFPKQAIPNLNAILYVESKKKIWTNISKFGITGARALVEPNQFQLFLKLEQQYIDGDFAYLQKLLKLDFISYQTLENLLLGKIFVDLTAQDYNLTIANDQYHLQHKDNQTILNSRVKDTFTQEYWFDGNFHLNKAEIFYPKKNTKITVEYGNLILTNKHVLPQNVKILIKDKKEKKIELEYSNFEFKSMPTPYKVPKNYTKKEL